MTLLDSYDYPLMPHQERNQQQNNARDSGQGSCTGILVIATLAQAVLARLTFIVNALVLHGGRQGAQATTLHRVIVLLPQVTTDFSQLLVISRAFRNFQILSLLCARSLSSHAAIALVALVFVVGL